jgi:hypothetical protein
MSREESKEPRLVDVPTMDAAAHLLTALYVLALVRGRDRTPGVEAWVSHLRVTLTEVLPEPDVRRVHEVCESLRVQFENAA